MLSDGAVPKDVVSTLHPLAAIPVVCARAAQGATVHPNLILCKRLSPSENLAQGWLVPPPSTTNAASPPLHTTAVEPVPRLRFSNFNGTRACYLETALACMPRSVQSMADYYRPTSTASGRSGCFLLSGRRSAPRTSRRSGKVDNRQGVLNMIFAGITSAVALCTLWAACGNVCRTA